MEIRFRDRISGAENSPENETALNLAIFFWKIKKGTFEVTSPRIVAE